MTYSYHYPRPAVTVDCVVFGFDSGSELESQSDSQSDSQSEPQSDSQSGAALKVLLIRRKLPPYEGRWALPGGFVQITESVDEAAVRELREETGVADVYLEQLYTFGAVGRDPRDRVISVAYYALISLSSHPVQAATDASDARWFDLKPPLEAERTGLPALGFDHQEILDCAIARLRAKIRYEPIGFELLPPAFTLSQLQKLYEQILQRPLDKRNFRKKILQMDLLINTGNKETGVAHRAAQLYRFDAEKYQTLKENGFSFEL